MSRNRKGGGLSAILVVLVLSMVIILLCGVYIQIRDAQDGLDAFSSSVKENVNQTPSSSSTQKPPVSSSSTVEEEPPVSSSSTVEKEPEVVTVNMNDYFRLTVNSGELLDVKVSKTIFEAFPTAQIYFLWSDQKSGELSFNEAYVVDELFIDSGVVVGNESALSFTSYSNDTIYSYTFSTVCESSETGYYPGFTAAVKVGNDVFYKDLSAYVAAAHLFTVQGWQRFTNSNYYINPVFRVDMNAWEYLQNQNLQVSFGVIFGTSTDYYTPEKYANGGWVDSNMNSCFFDPNSSYAFKLPFWSTYGKYLVDYSETIPPFTGDLIGRVDDYGFETSNGITYYGPFYFDIEEARLDVVYYARTWVCLTDGDGTQVFIYDNTSRMPSLVEGWSEWIAELQ